MPEEVEVLGLDYADMGWNGYKLKQGNIAASAGEANEVKELKVEEDA